MPSSSAVRAYSARGLTEQVERDVGQRDVVLERRVRSTTTATAGARARGVVAEAQRVRRPPRWRPRGSQLLHFLGNRVERGVAINLVGGRVEERVLLVGDDAVITDDGTTQMLTPSMRRVYTSRALRSAISASAACRLPTWSCESPRLLRMKTSQSGADGCRCSCGRLSAARALRCVWRLAALAHPGAVLVRLPDDVRCAAGCTVRHR